MRDWLFVQNTACTQPDVEEAAVAMDEPAFQIFYRRTAGPLRAYVTRVLGGANQADDIVQESYMRFLRSAPVTADPQHLRAFLFRIAANLMVDHWRRLGRERSAAEEAGPPVEAAGPDIPLKLDMTRLFNELRPADRQLLWLAYVEGADHKEIAGAMGIRERSVRVLLHRARQKLAQLIGKR